MLEFRDGLSDHFYVGDIGMGLGFVIDSKVYFGADGSAGEFRSVHWRPGHRSQFAIADEEAANILQRPEELSRMVDEISQHIAFLVNTLNLKAVYLGGDVATYPDLLISTIRAAIINNWPYSENVDCRVELAAHARDIVSIGAAAMVLDHIFSEPRLHNGIRGRNDIWNTILSIRSSSISQHRQK